MVAKIRNNGQTCVCAHHIFVHDAVYDASAETLTQRVGALHVGNGLDPGVRLGPTIDRSAVGKVEEHIAQALAQGHPSRLAANNCKEASSPPQR